MNTSKSPNMKNRNSLPVVQIDFLKGAKVLSFVGTYYFNLLLAIFLTRVIEINKQS